MVDYWTIFILPESYSRYVFTAYETILLLFTELIHKGVFSNPCLFVRLKKPNQTHIPTTGKECVADSAFFYGRKLILLIQIGE